MTRMLQLPYHPKWQWVKMDKRYKICFAVYCLCVNSNFHIFFVNSVGLHFEIHWNSFINPQNLAKKIKCKKIYSQFWHKNIKISFRSTGLITEKTKSHFLPLGNYLTARKIRMMWEKNRYHDYWLLFWA